MSFPLNPIDGQETTQNGIIYNYSTSTNSWRRNFNKVIKSLFLSGTDNSTDPTTGTLIVVGGVGIGLDLQVGGSEHIYGNLIIEGTLNTLGTANLSPIGGDVIIEPTLGGTVTIFPNSVGHIDNVIIGSNSNVTGNFFDVNVKDTFNSINPQTGALTVAGGVGIAKDLWIGGTLHAANISTYGTSTWYYTNTNYVAKVNDRLLIDTSATTVTVVLPLLPSLGDTVDFIDYSGNFGTNNLIFDGNGQKIMGLSENLFVDIDFAANKMVYIDSSQGWKIGVIF